MAIIGVLSVGGIVGYRAAMDRHKANEFFDLWHKADVERTAQIATNPNSVKVELSKGDIEISYTQSDEYLAIAETTMIINNMDKNVCKSIKDAKLGYWGFPEGFSLDGMDCMFGDEYNRINGVLVEPDEYLNYFSVCLNQEGTFSYQLYYSFVCYKNIT